MKYDFCVVGGGLSGLTVARELTNNGYRVLLVEKQSELGGNCRVHTAYGQTVSSFDIHVWHTKNKELHDYITRYTHVTPFQLQAVAQRDNRLYSIPINLQTLYQFYGIATVPEAIHYYAQVKHNVHTHTDDPDTVAGYCQRTIGTDLYELLIKEQIEKHWGRPANTLHKRIIQRIPYRTTWNNRYFDTYEYEGIPNFRMLFTNMADGIDTWLNCDYTHHRAAIQKMAARIVYTGSLDTYYEYCYGVLPYRTLSFTYEQATDHQQAAMVLYPQKIVPFTRSVDYGILFPEQQNTTVLGKAYPQEWNEASGMERMYPIDDTDSAAMYARYVQRAKADGLLYTGRLARYQYMNMDQVIASARTLVDSIVHGG